MKNLQIAGFLVIFSVAAQAAAFGGYSPVAGKPWAPGATSMDAFRWRNWSVGAALVTNNATVSKTWTVPLDSIWQPGFGQGAGTLGVAMKSGASPTTAQSVVNDVFGARVFTSGVVSSTSTTMSTYSLETLGGDSSSSHIVYINYVVPWKGSIGTITRLKLLF